uniref:Putative secreted protein n=1 Tax=Anopheles darlingi TaxID=43151 RepID=A0A2M4D0M5_ANODA
MLLLLYVSCLGCLCLWLQSCSSVLLEGVISYHEILDNFSSVFRDFCRFCLVFLVVFCDERRMMSSA